MWLFERYNLFDFELILFLNENHHLEKNFGRVLALRHVLLC